MRKPAVLLDKNYLHAARTQTIQALAATHSLLMPDVLFYEVLSADEPKRSKLLAKVRMLSVPFVLLKPLRDLLRLEMERHECCGVPSDHAEPVDPQAVLRAMAPVPRPSWADKLFLEETTHLQAEVSSYRRYIAEVRRLFPQLVVGSDEARSSMRQVAEEVIADAAQMKTFYGTMASVPRPGDLRAPPAELVDEHWACFRLMQVKLLFAIEHTHRLGPIEQPLVLSGKAFNKLEHDVLDQQYLIAGVLEGAFATEEVKLQHWFRLLRPDGELHCVRAGTRAP